jgi:hypothetical protein
MRDFLIHWRHDGGFINEIGGETDTNKHKSEKLWGNKTFKSISNVIQILKFLKQHSMNYNESKSQPRFKKFLNKNFNFRDHLKPKRV